MIPLTQNKISTGLVDHLNADIPGYHHQFLWIPKNDWSFEENSKGFWMNISKSVGLRAGSSLLLTLNRIDLCDDV